LTRITRLAPSPTGALHLGNARTFLINWLLARSEGWQIVLRIEDLDGPRVKKGADTQAIEDLRWLGLDWDQGPFYQSRRRPVYTSALDRLLATGQAYACTCTRREVELAASAPHASDADGVYPGTCRGRYHSLDHARQDGRPAALRFAAGAQTVEFDDQFLGPHQQPMAALGDFVIAKADGTPAYQLAVVVDDADMGITDVMRGDDLLDSTPRQILLYHALELQPHIPRYWHLPLVKGPDGRRLAKRHGDTRLGHYRQQGVSAGRVLGLLARWCGIEVDGITTAADLLGHFHMDRIPRVPIIFTEADERYLLG